MGGSWDAYFAAVVQTLFLFVVRCIAGALQELRTRRYELLAGLVVGALVFPGATAHTFIPFWSWTLQWALQVCGHWWWLCAKLDPAISVSVGSMCFAPLLRREIYRRNMRLMSVIEYVIEGPIHMLLVSPYLRRGVLWLVQALCIWAMLVSMLRVQVREWLCAHPAMSAPHRLTAQLCGQLRVWVFAHPTMCASAAVFLIVSLCWGSVLRAGRRARLSDQCKRRVMEAYLLAVVLVIPLLSYKTPLERCQPAIVFYLSVTLFGVLQAMPTPPQPAREQRPPKLTTKHKGARARRVIHRRMYGRNSLRGATPLPCTGFGRKRRRRGSCSRGSTQEGASSTSFFRMLVLWYVVALLGDPRDFIGSSLALTIAMDVSWDAILLVAIRGIPFVVQELHKKRHELLAGLGVVTVAIPRATSKACLLWSSYATQVCGLCWSRVCTYPAMSASTAGLLMVLLYWGPVCRAARSMRISNRCKTWLTATYFWAAVWLVSLLSPEIPAGICHPAFLFCLSSTLFGGVQAIPTPWQRPLAGRAHRVMHRRFHGSQLGRGATSVPRTRGYSGRGTSVGVGSEGNGCGYCSGEQGQEGGRSGGGGGYSWGSGGSGAAGGGVPEAPVTPAGTWECSLCGRQNPIGVAECRNCSGGRKRYLSDSAPSVGDPSKRQATKPLVAPSGMAGIGGTHATPEGLGMEHLHQTGVGAQPVVNGPIVGGGSSDIGRGVGSNATEGEFPGSVIDTWQCVCHVLNPSDRRTCRECGRVAFWNADLTGVGGTHVWVPTPEGMNPEPLGGAGIGLRNGGIRHGLGGEKDEVDGGVGNSASDEGGDGRVGDDRIATAGWCIGDDGMEIVAPSPAAPSSGGDGGAGAASSSSRTAPHARRTRSGVSRPTGSAAPDRPKKKKRRASCNKPVCGVPEGGSEEPVCWACEEPPTDNANGKRWRHYRNDDAVNEARVTWSARMALGLDRGRVKDGKEPANECFCERTDCMYKTIERWQLEDARCSADPDDVCAVCRTGLGSTTKLRRPGVFLHALRTVFSQPDPAKPQQLPVGSTLDENSIICQKCYMRGANFVNSMKNGPGQHGVREELTLRYSCQPLQNNSVAGARSLAVRKFLEVLADGGFVYLAHGVDIYEEARREAGVEPIGDKSLAEDVRNLFRGLGTALNDAEFCTWRGGEVGSKDRRTVHQYLMPRAVSHLEIAKLHESLLATEQELAECKKIARQTMEHFKEGGSSVQEEREAIVEKAGSIIRTDISLHAEWDNRKRGRDLINDFKVEIPDPREYVNKHFPRTLAVLLTTVCGCQDLLAGDGAGVEPGEVSSVVAGGGGESAVAGRGDESVMAGGGSESAEAGGGGESVSPAFQPMEKQQKVAELAGGGGEPSVAGGGEESVVARGGGESAIAGGGEESVVARGGGESAVAGGVGESAIAGGGEESVVARGGGESAVAGRGGEAAVAGGDMESVLAEGGGERTSVKSAGDKKQQKADSRDAVFTYMVGTMIGKAVQRMKYMAPHDLKLSQAFKMRGMSQKNMAFLSSIRVCWGDGVRYNREKCFGGVADESLLEASPDFALAVSWDNNDADPHAAVARVEHLSQIGACGHQVIKAGLPTLGLESLWKKVGEVTLPMVRTGGNRADNDATIDRWNRTLFKILGDSPRYLSAEGEDQSCLEIKIQDEHTAVKCKVASKNLFLQAGSTKRLADNEAALDRIQRCCHAGMVWKMVDGKWQSTVRRRVLVEGDEETYRIMVQLKKGNPEKYKWLLPHPGGWHIMLHVTKALISRYYGAGVEVVAKALGGDDKHAAGGGKYRRNHHLLTVTYEAMWWAVIEKYIAATKGAGASPDVASTGSATPSAGAAAWEGAPGAGSGAGGAPVNVEQDVVPWLREQAKEHKTMRLWATFLLEDYPRYLMFRTGGRTANYKLCVAAFGKFAPLFAATGKNRYQQLASWHLLNLARMTDDDLEAVSSLFSSQYNTKNYRNFNNIFLDEFMEMTNRTVKQNLGRITQAYMVKLPRICDSRRAAVDEVDARLYPSYSARDVRRGIIKLRAGAINKAKAVLEKSFAFTVEGKDQLRSLSGAVTTARKAEAMLNANKIAEDKFDKVLMYEALGDLENGTKPSTSKIPFFAAENNTCNATTAPTSTVVARRDLKDMDSLANEFWEVIKTAMTEEDMTREQWQEILASIGIVLPLALAHAGDGGAYGVNKAAGVKWAFDTYCPDAIQGEPFYSFGGFAYDWATEIHRSPSVVTCDKGAIAYLDHYRNQIYSDLATYGSVDAAEGRARVVACCYDDPKEVPPIKAATQKKRLQGLVTTNIVFDAASSQPIPTGNKYSPFLRRAGNRDKIASHLWQRITTHPDGRGNAVDASFLAFGVSPVVVPPVEAAGGGGGARSSAATSNVASASSACPGEEPSTLSGEQGSSAAKEKPLDARVWKQGALAATSVEGPGIGEGELSTTYAIIHHALYTGLDKVRSWLITSTDSDQILHILLAFASGKIKPTGPDKVQVTVRQRKGEGAIKFVDVNRIYTALVGKPAWGMGAGEGGVTPAWLDDNEGQAKVVLFVIMYFLGGCDFLPGFYNLKMPSMFTFVLEAISQPGLFSKPVVVKVDGKWTIDIEECVKMLGVCYFQMHWKVFQVVYAGGAAELLQAVDGDKRKFIEKVRLIIFKAMGKTGRRNCPDWHALTFQVERADRVLGYWQTAFDTKVTPVAFEGHGWVAEGKKTGEELSSGNCCIKLSAYALLNLDGKVKMLTCKCTGGKQKKPFCEGSCRCHVKGIKCVPMHCTCRGACVKNRADRAEEIARKAREAAEAAEAAAAARAAATAEAAAAATSVAGDHGPPQRNAGVTQVEARRKAGQSGRQLRTHRTRTVIGLAYDAFLRDALGGARTPAGDGATGHGARNQDDAADGGWEPPAQGGGGGENPQGGLTSDVGARAEAARQAGAVGRDEGETHDEEGAEVRLPSEEDGSESGGPTPPAGAVGNDDEETPEEEGGDVGNPGEEGGSESQRRLDNYDDVWEEGSQDSEGDDDSLDGMDDIGIDLDGDLLVDDEP